MYSRPATSIARSRAGVIVRASAEGDNQPKSDKSSIQRRRRRAPEPQDAAGLELNPIELGRKSRQIFDDVWSRFSTLGLISRGAAYDDDFEDFRDESRKEFETPQAEYTSVLVVGATGRVGRVLMRKLLLRGYTKVKALVRPGSPGIDLIPRKVDVIEGDVADLATCRRAVVGVTKVVYCAGVEPAAPAEEQQKVYEQGVENLVVALQDEVQRRKSRKDDAASTPGAPVRLGKKNVANFSKERDRTAWKTVEVEAKELVAAASSRASKGKSKDEAGMAFTEEGALRFAGTLYTRGRAAKIGCELEPGALADTDSVILRVRGDGNTYACVLKGRNGQLYSTRFTPKKGFSSVKLSLSSFKTADGKGIKGEDAVFLGLRYDYKSGKGAVVDNEDAANKFTLDLEWIKATPKGEEPDFILVSRKSAPEYAKLRTKGEDSLRSSGLGFTVIRPGALVEEAGGYRALVFDQGNRITQSISCADVADVCLRSLHESAARNITFEVCYEYTAEEKGEAGLYELVAHLPKKGTNYLALGLSALEQS